MIPKKLLGKIHPSWMLAMWGIGAIVGAVFETTTKNAGFAAEMWVIVSIVGLVLTIIMNYRISLLLAFMSGLIIVGNRAAPSFIGLEQIKSIYGNEVEISGKIVNDLDISESKIALVLEIERVTISKSKTLPEIRGTPKVYVILSAKLDMIEMPRRSDILTIQGVINEGFGNYAGSMFRPKITEVIRPSPGDFFLEVRDGFAEKIREYLSEPEAGLALGYLLGVKTEVDEDFLEMLQVVGLTHIIVASGTQLSILSEVAKKIFGKLSRFAGMTGAMLLIICFTGMVGLSPSMLRAGIVAIMSLGAWYFGREQKTWRMLLLVIAGTLVYDPTSLNDLGWQLSFGSFFGLLIIGPKLKKFFFGEREPGFIGETIFSSLAAGIAVLPILLYSFGSVSLISIVMNLLILPTISPVMGLTFTVGMGAMLLGDKSQIITWIAELTKAILDYHIGMINLLGSFEFFLVKVPKNNPMLWLIYAPILLLIIPYEKIFRRKNEISPEELIFTDSEIGILPDKLVLVKENVEISNNNTNKNNGITDTIKESDDVGRKRIECKKPSKNRSDKGG